MKWEAGPQGRWHVTWTGGLMAEGSLHWQELQKYLTIQLKKKKQNGAPLVVQWIKIRLPMQGTWVRSLVWKDPTCFGTTKLVHHNY